MLRKLEVNEFDKYVQFAYELNMKAETSSYPIYYDGIKTKEEFINDEAYSLKSDTSEILLFIVQDKVIGWINYYWIEEEKYLQVSTCSIKESVSVLAKELVSYFNDRFNGYDLFIGFPEENKDAINAFMENGFRIHEESFNTNIIEVESIKTKEKSNDVLMITKDNYSLFETLHTETDEEMYWTSNRIYEDLDNWLVFVSVKKSIPYGAICAFVRGGFCEIFGLNFKDKFNSNIFMELVNVLLIECKKRKIKSIGFFVDEEELLYAEKLGFKNIGKYIGLKK